jgi:hypothetical protein
MAGFAGGWTTLFTKFSPNTGGASAETIRATAETVDVPVGDEINGGAVKFVPPGAPDAGQNLRAAAVVYQWQPASTGGSGGGLLNGYSRTPSGAGNHHRLDLVAHHLFLPVSDRGRSAASRTDATIW